MALHIIRKSFIFCLLFFCGLISSKQLTPDHKVLKSVKLNECHRCKLLTKSFNYWLEKTSRSKYEGGDAAWEEAKLKSYARSEIRLVEIQEGLCSELKKYQEHCYTLSEEAEPVLEKWWFHEDASSKDLYTWLCIETLRYCCPSNHYGDMCTPCPLDKNNNICNGNGKCHGEGTRKGNGTCMCKRGYTGKHCEECSTNYYSVDTTCWPCHESCNGCSYVGPSNCITCKTGWEPNSGMCVDIDECQISSICNEHEYCINKEGSYKCLPCDKTCKTCKGEGSANCTSCDNFYFFNGACLDEKQRSNILIRAFVRAVAYILLITVMVFLTGSSASYLVLLAAVHVYFAESTIQGSLYDVIFHIFS